MAKNWSKAETEQNSKEEMSVEDARAARAAIHAASKPAGKTLSEQEKREQFRLFWAQEKSKYGKTKALEQILWVHLQSAKLDSPEKFEEGLAHFGLKKVR